MCRPADLPARSPRRCSSVVSSALRRHGCISTSMPGTRRRNRGGRRARNARPRARSMRCWSRVMAERPQGGFDPRVTPARPELAAKYLEGRVAAERFVEGDVREVVEAQAPVRRSPSPDAPLDTEALRGERVIVYETTPEGWAWGQLEVDRYVGWFPANALRAPGPAPTHKVAALRTLVFPGPSIKLPPVEALSFGCRLPIARIEQPFAVTASGGYVPVRHLAPLGAKE